ncbi:MAG: DotA/TraY family protein [Coxiellaceae bacterium]|nr:DotA/TraY family protein [Coxiellaceae bacterium]
MGRLLTAILMMLFAGIALAAEPGSLQQAQSFAFSLTPPMTDRSVAYLGLIFGTVGNVLQGTGGQILGQMFAVFNKGVMVVAALWLAMTTAQIALRSASEGSFMGQNKSVHLVFLRVALGFSLILPSSSTGYSLLQDIFMKVVVSGVALADQTWNAALNYMSYGGALYIPPTSITATQGSSVANAFIIGSSNNGQFPAGYATVSNNAAQFPAVLGPAAQIFQDEVCMLRSGSRAWNAGNTTQYSFDIQMDPVNGVIYFPGLGDQNISSYTQTAGSSPKETACGYVQSYCTTSSQNCGETSQSGYTGSVDMTGSVAPTAAEAVQMKWNYSWLAMKQLVVSLMPAAQNYVAEYPVFEDNNFAANVFPSANDTSSFISENAKTFFTAILAYGNLMTPVQTMVTSTQNFQAEEASGWITAGGFYWNIEQSNKASSAGSATNLIPSAATPSPVRLVAGLGGESQSNPISELVTAAAESVGGTDSVGNKYTGYSADFQNFWSQYTGAANSSAAASEESHQNSGGIVMEIIMAILGGMSGSPLGVLAGLNSGATSLGANATQYNPIAFLMVEGNMIIQFVAAAWSGALVISGVLAIGAGICNSTSPGGLIFKTIMTWIKSIFMMLTTVLLVPGVILSFYVPMYPFAVFTFAVIGWIMMVVEGMAAAPLICVGVTHPEGHDFLGKGEQALMFFLGIFVRPSLLVIGLIASMLVSFIAFQILLAGYAHIWSALPTLWAASLAEIFLVFINYIMGLVVFAGFTMEIIEQSYKLTFQLPQYVMKWIGGPEMGQDYGQMASQLKGTVQSGGGSLKEGAGSFDQGTSAALRGADKAKGLHEKKQAGASSAKTNVNVSDK